MERHETQRRYVDPRTGRGPFTHAGGQRPEARKLPNIVLISMDMVPREFTPGAPATPGNPTPEIPNMTALCREGVSYRNAFSTSPLCTPSRASYLTGRFSYITSNEERGHDGHTFHLRPEDVIFPEYLKAAGYHCRHVGKCHVGSAKFTEVFGENDAPWDRWSPPWYDDDDYMRFLRERGLGRYRFERPLHGIAPESGGRGTFYGGWLAGQAEEPFPADATYPAYLADRAINALESRQPDQEPFYLQLDFFAPHQPFAIPGDMAEREAEIRSRIGLPRSYEILAGNGFSAPWPEPRVYRLYRKAWGLTDPATALDYRVANLLQFELVDRQIGRLLRYLKDRELYDDAWVILLGDHGEMNCELALADKGAYLHPRVTRVPLCLKAASTAGIPAASTVQTPVSLLDLSPTVRRIAGVTAADRQDGADLLGRLDGSVRPEDKPILFEIWSHLVPNPSVGLVFSAAADGRLYSYVYNASDDLDEMYDLDAEDEYRNIVAARGKSEILSEARGLMAERLRGDHRWIGYFHAFRLEYAEELPGRLFDRQLFRRA